MKEVQVPYGIDIDFDKVFNGCENLKDISYIQTSSVNERYINVRLKPCGEKRNILENPDIILEKDNLKLF